MAGLEPKSLGFLGQGLGCLNLESRLRDFLFADAESSKSLSGIPAHLPEVQSVIGFQDLEGLLVSYRQETNKPRNPQHLFTAILNPKPWAPPQTCPPPLCRTQKTHSPCTRDLRN